MLARWATDHRLIPQLAPVISDGLTREELNGVKILFGGSGDGDLAEVRINGSVDPRSSEALLSLPWPRPAQPVYARTFILLAHPEADAGGQTDQINEAG